MANDTDVFRTCDGCAMDYMGSPDSSFCPDCEAVTPRNSYEAKQEARRNRLEAAADRAEARAEAAYKRADMSEAATGIPFGQPVLVGHHSEGRHRRAIEKADKAMRASIDESKRAAELRERAAGVGTAGVSSDDPEAIAKLTEQLAKAEQVQEQMKEANKIIRKWMKKGVTHQTTGGDFDGLANELAQIGSSFTPENVRSLITPSMGTVGFPSFRLTNNSANISRLKKRIAALTAAAQRETKAYDFQGVCEVIQNAEANRVQIIFPGKPDADTRATLKSNGFRWAPSENAWQRQLNNAGIYAARRVLTALGVSL